MAGKHRLSVPHGGLRLVDADLRAVKAGLLPQGADLPVVVRGGAPAAGRNRGGDHRLPVPGHFGEGALHAVEHIAEGGGGNHDAAVVLVHSDPLRRRKGRKGSGLIPQDQLIKAQLVAGPGQLLVLLLEVDDPEGDFISLLRHPDPEVNLDLLVGGHVEGRNVPGGNHPAVRGELKPRLHLVLHVEEIAVVMEADDTLPVRQAGAQGAHDVFEFL